MSFIISIGKWGGMYCYFGYTWRVCFGWIAFTIIPNDFDTILENVIRKREVTK